MPSIRDLGVCYRVGLSNMNNDLNNIFAPINIIPKYGHCDDFYKNNNSSRKTIWLVPHIIKYREDSQIIIWRCNWGNTCESGCIYSMAKKRDELVLTDLGANDKTSQ